MLLWNHTFDVQDTGDKKWELVYVYVNFCLIQERFRLVLKKKNSQLCFNQFSLLTESLLMQESTKVTVPVL